MSGLWNARAIRIESLCGKAQIGCRKIASQVVGAELQMIIARVLHFQSDQVRAEQPGSSAIRDTVRHIAFIAAVVLFLGAITLLRIMLSMRGLL
jgi:hypothetical protein